jgi:hypothetical protein
MLLGGDSPINGQCSADDPRGLLRGEVQAPIGNVHPAAKGPRELKIASSAALDVDPTLLAEFFEQLELGSLFGTNVPAQHSGAPLWGYDLLSLHVSNPVFESSSTLFLDRCSETPE